MRRAGLFAVFALGALLGLPWMPAARAPDAPPDVFSAGRAMRLVEAWATEPRPTGSDAHARVLYGLGRALSDVGFSVGSAPFGGRVSGTNLVAAPPGRAEASGAASPDAAAPADVWLVAHSDSVPGSPGAADDALGLAVAVEAARALSVGGVPPRLRVLITDAEEEGLFGAKAHVREGGPPGVLLNVEARGTEGPAYMFQTAGPPGPMLDAWRASGCGAQATSLARAVYEVLPNDTDFTVFRRAGWWGYDFALIHGAWRYHTAEDTPEHLDPRSVQQVGDCVVGLARAWLARLDGHDADGPGALGAAGAAAGAAEDARVYAQAAGRTVVLPPLLLQVLGGATLLALLAGAARGGRAGLRGLVVGGIAWLVALGVTVGAGIGLLAAFEAVRADFWERPAEVAGPHAHWALAAAVGAGASLGLAWIARRLAPGATRGWHVAAGLLAAVVAIALPTVGYLLLPGALVSGALLRGRPGLALVPAALAGVVLAPFLHAIFPALTTRLTPILCVVPALVLAWLVRVEPAPRAPTPRVEA